MPVETERVTLRLPVTDLQALDAFIQAGEYMNRSDVIRAAIKAFVRSRAQEVMDGADARKKLMEAASQHQQLVALQEQLKAQQQILDQLIKK